MHDPKLFDIAGFEAKLLALKWTTTSTP